jgi:hypothetical protein
VPFVVVGLILNVVSFLFDAGGPSPPLRVVSTIVLVAGVTVWARPSAPMAMTSAPADCSRSVRSRLRPRPSRHAVGTATPLKHLVVTLQDPWLGRRVNWTEPLVLAALVLVASALAVPALRRRS